MNGNIEKAKVEFKNKNYRKALSYLNCVRKDDEDYEYAQVYEFGCLFELGCYGKALEVIDSLISKNPRGDLFWYEKVRCHIFLDENDKAEKALGELERICDEGDKRMLLRIARLHFILENFDKTMEYSEKALAIDEGFEPALYQKAMVALMHDDMEMMDDVSKRIQHVSKGDLFSLLPAVLMNLFSGKYEEAYGIIEGSDEDSIKEKFAGSLKKIIYKRMSEDLNAKVLLSQDVAISVDDALKVMFDFKNTGKDHGEIDGIQYFIL